MKKAYMYGFRKDNIEETGFLRVSPDGYSIVNDVDDATGFSYKNTTRRKHWASPEKWLGFFNDDPDLEDWKFHIVDYNR